MTQDLEVARKWFRMGVSLDGVIAKRRDLPYQSGERTGMQKIKRQRTADCVVGGFRYLEREPLVGSLLLGLYNDEGKLDHVGFTSSIQDKDRPALTKKLKKMIKPPGFTGKAPRRFKSLEHEALCRMETSGTQPCRRGSIRSFHWGPIPARDEILAMASGKIASGLHAQAS